MDGNFTPIDGLGLLASYGYKAPPPTQEQGPPIPKDEDRRVMEAAEYARKGNEVEPGRYEIVAGSDVEAWQEDWQKKEASSGVAGDIKNLLLLGTNSLASGVREVVRAIPKIGPVIVEGLDGIDKWRTGKDTDAILKDNSAYFSARLTPAMQSARAKEFISEERNNDGTISYKLGPAWADPRSYIAGAIESVPGTALSMLPGGVLARGTYLRAIASGAGEKVAATAAARTALIAGGISEGLISGGQTAHEIREQISTLPEEVLQSSQAYQDLITGGKSPSEARKALTDDSAVKGFLLAGTATAMFGGHGDRVLAKIIAEGVQGGLGKRILSGAARGAVSEGLLEELPQSIGEKVAENAVMQGADPRRRLMEGVPNAAVSGAIAGGIMGAGLGGAGGAVSRKAEERTDPPIEAQVAVPAKPEAKGPLSRAVEYGAAQEATRLPTHIATPPGLPGAGENVAVEMEGGASFPARIEGYKDGEALVVDPASGEILQVPLSAIRNLAPEQYGQQIASAAEAATPEPPPVETRSVLPPAGETAAAKATLTGFPVAGQRAIVDSGKGERFAGGVQGYTSDPATGKEEAIIRKDDGSEMQVPVETLNVSSLTPTQVEKQEIEKNPPVARNKPTGGRIRSYNKRFVEMPDDLHARLYDLGRARTDQVRLLGVSKLEIDRASEGEQIALAEALRVGTQELGQIADDYRYRVERAARGARSDLPVKMHKVNDRLLERKRAESARAADKQMEGVNVPAIPVRDDGHASNAPVAAVATDQQAGSKAVQESAEANETPAAQVEQSRAVGVPVANGTVIKEQALNKPSETVKWFGARDRAQSYMDKKKIGATHEIVEAARGRFEVRPKAATAERRNDADLTSGSHKSVSAKPKMGDVIRAAQEEGRLEIMTAGNEKAKKTPNALPEGLPAIGDVVHLRVAGSKARPTSYTIKKYIELEGEWVFKARDEQGGQITDSIRTLNAAKSPSSSPKAEPSKKSSWVAVGNNSAGYRVFEDERGVRSFVRDGIRTTEPISLSLNRDGGTDISINKEDRNASFWAVGEIEQTEAMQNSVASSTIEKETGPSNADKINALFASNTLFTADKVEAARARLRSKLTQINSGIDPEILMDGMTIAGAYLESGVRSFADYAKRMIEDFGPKVKPYLLSFWEGARHFPGIDNAGMTPAAESKALHDEIMKERDSVSTSDDAINAAPATIGVEQSNDAEPDAGNAVPSIAGSSPAGVSALEERKDPAPDNQPDRRTTDGRDRASYSEADRGRGNDAGTTSPPRHGDQDARGDRAGRSDPRFAGDGDERGSGTHAGSKDQEPDLRADQRDELERGGSARVRGRNGEIARNSGSPSPVSAVGKNFRIAPGAIKRIGSWRETAERNVTIVELVKMIEKEGRRPTPDEAALMSRFTGWGASEIANSAFGDRNGQFKPGWESIGQRLKAALTETEYAQAKRTTQYAHYTGEDVIRPIYSALERMGFTGGRVLEPGMGIGLFNGLMPAAMASASRYTGVEYDTITGAIAKLLYPQSDVIVGDFTKTPMPRDYFDLAVGNPPFSPTVVSNDPAYKKNRFMLHDYFFAKTLDSVKPGGVLVFVTSKGTMDKANDIARRYLAARANLVGAIRLPQTAFKDNAGTEVVTDILFLQKRGAGVVDNGVSWKGLGEVDTRQGKTLVNEYFVANPEMVLGAHALTGSMYRANTYTVEPKTGASIEEQLSDAIANLPENIVKVRATGTAAIKAAEGVRDYNPKIRKEGGLYIGEDGSLMQVNGGGGILLTTRSMSDGKTAPLKEKETEFLKDWVGVRDALKVAYKDQLTDGDWQSSLSALRKAYDAFVAKHGRLREFTTIERDDGDGNVTVSKRFKNDPLLRIDVEGVLAHALEKIDDVAGTITPDRVLTERVLEKRRTPEVKTVQDALFVSLDGRGKLDIDHVAALAGLARDEVIAALGSEIYETPMGGWETSDQYLSGDVRQKLRDAKAATALDKRFGRNVEALLGVQPRPLGPSEITVNLGQNWIASKYVESFAKDVVGEDFTVRYSDKIAQWIVDTGYGRTYGEYNTPKMNAADILKAVLNNKEIKVTEKDSDGKSIIDTVATEAALAVANKMRESFRSWVWTDKARADELVDFYNEHFNNIAPRKFDGSHLTLPGVNSRIELRPHQKRAIWRAVQEGDTYLAHAVGAGKTYTMIAVGMEERRLGLVKKPMYVVPNHMLAQFSREFLELYPAANIMVADEQNFHTSNRRRFVAQAALNDPDAIILTHSAFGRLAMSDGYSARFIQSQIDEWTEARDDVDKSDRITLKQIERQIEQFERRLAGKAGDTSKKDQALTFEELGVDRLIVDEGHEFRKLDFATNQGRIKGIDPSGSQRAMDLHMKVQYLREKNGKRALVMASGTPVTNTMGELFTVQRLFQPDQLTTDNHSAFDAWANHYGAVTSGFEQNAAGGYEIVARFAKFMNVPELMQRVRSFMDILTSADLGALVKRPDVKGGGRQIIVTDTSLDYQGYKRVLEDRIKTIRQRKGRTKPGDDIILTVIADGRFAAIDMRFVDTEAKNDEGSKLNRAIDDVISVYKATADRVYYTDGKPDPLKGASILLFSDIGLGEQAAERRGFDMRAWIEKRLIDAGIPAEHFAFMRDHKAHAKKERLFADMREGKKRILIGGKDMETGVNVQKRLAWLGHLDAPWFPASVEQREGRIVRQGNQNAQVEIKAYATKGSYDSTMWGMNARKARFIEQAFSGDESVRSLEDVSEASSFEVAAALASGDERYMKLAGMKADIDRLERLAKAHHDDQRKLSSSKYVLNSEIEQDKAAAIALEKAIKERQPIRAGAFEAKIGGKVLDTREAWSNALFRRFSELASASAGDEKGQKIGEIGGFPLMFRATETLGSYKAMVHVGVPVKTEAILQYPFDADMAITGIATRAANVIASLDRRLFDTETRITGNQRRVAQIDQRLGAPFAEQAILIEKFAEMQALQAELAAEKVEEPAPSVEAATIEINPDPAVEGETNGNEARKYSIAPPQPDTIPNRMENLVRGKEALSRLLTSRAPASAPQWHAMHRHGLGWISFLWEAGPRGELGIAHIMEGRADQGKNTAFGNTRLTGKALTDFIRETIPSIVVDGKLGRWYQEGNYISRNLYSAKGTVVIRPNVVFDGARARINFIATAFPGAGKEMPVQASPVSNVDADKRIEKMLADAKGRGVGPYSVATQLRPSADGAPSAWVGPSTPLAGGDLGRAGSGSAHAVSTFSVQQNTDFGNRLRAELAAHPLGAVAQRLMEAGTLKVIEQVPAEAPNNAQGWTDGDGTITLVADTIPEGRAMAVLLHEAFHAGARPLLGETAWHKLMAEVKQIYRQFQHGTGPARAFFDAARQSVRAAGVSGEALAIEEFAAYAIEHAEAAPRSLRLWIDRVIGHIKAWLLRRFGVQIGAVTPSELRAIATAAMRQTSPTETTTGSVRYSEKQMRRVSNKLGELIGSIAKGGGDKRPIIAGQTPEVMAALGVDGKYLTLRPDVIWKAIDKHGLTQTEIENAIKDAYDPLMVFKHPNGNLNTLGKTLDRIGRPLVLAASLQQIGDQKELVVTDIRTIHAKDGTGFVNEWIEDGRLRYWDQAGVALWLSSIRANSGRTYHLRPGTRLLTPKGKILHPEDVFKGGRKYSLASPALALPSRADAAIALKGKLTDLAPSMLAAVPLNYFSELKRPAMAAIDQYLGLKREMDTYRGTKHEQADKIAQEWLSYSRLGLGKNGKAKAAALAELMHDSTLAGFDPSKGPEQFGDKEVPEPYYGLRRRFESLPPKGQNLFEAARDAYKAQSEEMDAIILANVRRAMEIAAEQAQKDYLREIERIEKSKTMSAFEKAEAIDTARKHRAQAMQRSQWANKARITRLRSEFESSRLQGPYFPLARFGRYFVSLKDVDGDVMSFQRFENAAAMAKAIEEMRRIAEKQYPGSRVESGVLDEPGSLRQAMDPRMVAQIETILGGASVDPSIMDAIWQRYLQTMPEMSIRKRQIHRKGTAGFDGDALRVFSNHMFHASHQMARMKYGLELQEAVNKAGEQARKSDDPVRGTTLVNELRKRHQWVMNPTGGALAQKVTSAMFVWYLAASPASAAVNLTQTVLMGIPVLGARLGGVSKAVPALMRAAGDFIAGKGEARKGNLSADETRAMGAFYETGLIDRTRSHDLAGVGNTGAEYSPIRARIMEKVSWMFHQAEVFNREVTALAAYRLAREVGEDHETAVNTAHDLTWKTHFDYSNSNRPRIMQGDVAKVAFVFQNFQINMWYRFFRDLHQSLKGETAQARSEARYQIAGITGMLALMGGLTSVFGFKAIMMLAGLFFDDKDDPREFEAEFKANIMKMFGPDIGGMILKGVPGTLLNVDLASRIGMPDFLIRTRESNKEGRDAGLEWIAALMGASVSTVLNTFDGVKLIMDGNAARGLEIMAPKAVKDLMQAYRFADEGIESRKGNTILERDKLTAWDIGAKAIGFTSGRISETYERNRELAGAERRVLDERKLLIAAWATARMHEDDGARSKAMDAIKDFNARPYARGSIRITVETLTQSLHIRRRNDEKREEGVLIENKTLNKHLRGLMPERVFQ